MRFDERASLGITLTDEKFESDVRTLLDSKCLIFGVTDDFIKLADDIDKLFDFITSIEGSLEALPIVFDEFSSTITTAPPPEKEEVAIKDEVKDVFQTRPTDWLGAKDVHKLIMESTRRSKALTDKLGPRTEEILTKTMPMTMGLLRSEGFLCQDKKSGTMRWRGSSLEKEITEQIHSRPVLLLYEAAKIARERGDLARANEQCMSAIEEAIREVLEPFGDSYSKADFDRRLVILERLGTNTTSPISLESYSRSLTQQVDQTQDAGGFVLETCKLYLRRLQEKATEVNSRGAGEYLGRIQDPHYYLVLNSLETTLRHLIRTELEQIDGDWWKHRVPEVTRTNCEKRKNDYIRSHPEIDPSQPDLIEFTDFEDYRAIICRGDNWRDKFGKIFPNKVELEMKLEELGPIRKDIAHSRTPSNQDIKLLELYSEQVIHWIDSQRNLSSTASDTSTSAL